MTAEMQPDYTGFESQCSKIVEALRSKGEINKKDFDSSFQTGDWNRAAHGVAATLRSMGMTVEFTRGKVQLTSRWGDRYVTAGFRPDENREAKEAIGKLVAQYLEGHTESVFFGSGSTVFHIGKQMKTGRLYPQLFTTINIPLVAEWCERNKTRANATDQGAAFEDPQLRRYRCTRPSWKRTHFVLQQWKSQHGSQQQ